MSTVKAINIQHPSSANTNLVLDASGNMTVAGTVSSGTPMGMRNIIINGGMDIWQRATSQSVSGYGCVDRWYNINSGTTTISQDTSVPTGVPVQYSLKWLTGAATSYGQSFQAIERANVIRLRGQKVTLSCYIKTLSWTGNILLRSMYSNSSDAALTVIAGTGISDTITAGSSMTSWTRITNTFTVPADAVGLGVYILPDTVQSASGAAVWITGVQLELGSIATPFENRSYGVELALCQRYYQQMSFTGRGYCIGSTYSIDCCISWPAMRVAPGFNKIKNPSSTLNLYSGSLYGQPYAYTTSSGNFNVQGAASGDMYLYDVRYETTGTEL